MSAFWSKVRRRLARERDSARVHAARFDPGLRAARRRVEESGFFDPAWYLAQNPDVSEEGWDPADHFVACGAGQLRDPGPSFDSSRFFAVQGLNFLEFMGSGLPPPGPVACAPVTFPVSASPVPERIGVVIHAYHEEHLPELLLAAGNIRQPHRLYVATRTETGAEEARKHAAALRGEPAAVEILENRGRNVATWTSVFGRRLLEECDVFCHVHTKKSAHVSRTADRWRETSVENLLATGWVDRVLAFMEAHPKVGVLAPAPPSVIDMVAYSDGGNAGEVERLFRRLDLASHRADSYDYPVGNMFWARPMALRQLLDGRIQGTDFPGESGQLDGTLAHAVERSLALVANANGFRYAEANRMAGSIRTGMGSRNLWNYPQRARSSHLSELLAERKRVVIDPDGLLWKRRQGSRRNLWAELGRAEEVPDYASWRAEAEAVWPDRPLEETLARFTAEPERLLGLERGLEVGNLQRLESLADRLPLERTEVWVDDSLGATHAGALLDQTGWGLRRLGWARPGHGPKTREFWEELGPDCLFISSDWAMMGCLPPETGAWILKLMDPWALAALEVARGGTGQADFDDPFEGR